MNDVIKIHDENLDLRLQAICNWKIPNKLRSDLRLFIHELGLGKVNRGRRLKDSALLKYLNTLKLPLEFINKNADKIKMVDIETFEKALSIDALTSHIRQKPYRHSTKVGFRKALKVFIRWRLGEAKGRELVGWLDTRDRVNTPDYLKEEEIQKLYSSCRSAEQKYAVAILFDSGARAEEFINIRYEDVQMPDVQNKFLKIVLKQEYSKTMGRTVSLYWRNSLEAVKEYLGQRVEEGIRPNEPVFNNTYASLRMFLKRLGKKVLSKSVHAHLFRHSSATFFAAKMNRQELCYRFGWRFSSNMPDVYISRAGMAAKELDEKFAQTEINELKSELIKVELESKIKMDRLMAMEQKLEAITKHFSTIAEMERKGVTIEMVEAVLKKNNRL